MASFCVSRATSSLRKRVPNTKPSIYEIASSKVSIELGSGISSCGFTRGSLASVPLTVTSGRTSVSWSEWIWHDRRASSSREQGGEPQGAGRDARTQDAHRRRARLQDRLHRGPALLQDRARPARDDEGGGHHPVAHSRPGGRPRLRGPVQPVAG